MLLNRSRERMTEKGYTEEEIDSHINYTDTEGNVVSPVTPLK